MRKTTPWSSWHEYNFFQPKEAPTKTQRTDSGILELVPYPLKATHLAGSDSRADEQPALWPASSSMTAKSRASRTDSMERAALLSLSSRHEPHDIISGGSDQFPLLIRLL